MKPAAFDYLAPADLKEALTALAEAGEDGRILAGGQSLVPMLNMRLARPGLLVDVSRLPELGRIEERRDVIRIGAGVRQVTVERRGDLADMLPLVAQAMPWVGHEQLRSRGTICGSLAHADPSAELPLCLKALGGSVTLQRGRKSRTLSADEFFIGMMFTAVAPGEMIVSVDFPKREAGAGYAFRELARRAGDFAIVGCAAIAHAGGAARLTVAGVADTPQALDLPSGSADWDERINDFAWSLGARDDLHATARYRRMLVRRLGRATLEEAMSCRA